MNDNKQSQCANCGITADRAEGSIQYGDEEWVCSNRCYDQHDELGCPMETHDGYRHPGETEKFLARIAELEAVVRDGITNNEVTLIIASTLPNKEKYNTLMEQLDDWDKRARKLIDKEKEEHRENRRNK